MMQRSGRYLWRRWLTGVIVVMAIAVNALSNFYPPAGKNIGEVSNTTFANVLITPAGYAFAIWGLIYVGLIAFSFYQALPSQCADPRVSQVAWGVIGACILQMLWVYAFLLFYFWLSVALMLGILICLVAAYRQTRALPPTWPRRWLFQAPISVYFGWITVATVVNITSALQVSLPADWSTVSIWSMVLTGLMMAVSGAIAATIALKYADAAYPAVIVWALSAIAVRHAALPFLAILGVGLSVTLSAVIVRTVFSGTGRSHPRKSS
ncbi:MAG: tryptophan-rich sensory protein [Phormidesmis sp.]